MYKNCPFKRVQILRNISHAQFIHVFANEQDYSITRLMTIAERNDSFVFFLMILWLASFEMEWNRIIDLSFIRLEMEKSVQLSFFFLMIFCGIFFFQVILMRWHYRFERELDVVHLSFDTNRKCVSFRFGASEYFEWMCWNVWVHYLCGERKTKLVSPSSTKICIERACICFVLFQWFHIGSITLCFFAFISFFGYYSLDFFFMCVFFHFISFLIYLFIFPLLEILCC